MKTKLFATIAILACMLASCNREHLYYSYGEVAIIRVNVDWSATDLNPNGVSAYTFDHSTGKAVKKCIISSDPNSIDIELPIGTFDILIVNDTEYELNNIEFAGIEDLNNFYALITRQTESKFKGTQFRSDNSFISDCDVLAYDIIRDVKVEDIDVAYYYDKPNTNTVVISKEVTAHLQQAAELIDIELQVMNINSAAGAPRSQFTNLTPGFHFNTATKHEDLVIHEFVLNNRVIDPENYKLGKISKKMINFGFHRPENTDFIYDHSLFMNFVLVNGETHVVELDLNDLIESSHDGYQHVHTIRAAIEIPEAIGNGGGAFDPDVEEWDDIEVDLPI